MASYTDSKMVTASTQSYSHENGSSTMALNNRPEDAAYFITVSIRFFLRTIIRLFYILISLEINSFACPAFFFVECGMS